MATWAACPSRVVQAQFVVCPRLTWGGVTGVIRSHHALRRSSNFQPVPWPTAAIYAYERAWEGWWYLNTSNYTIWVDGPTASEPWGWWDSREVLERRSGFGATGQTYWIRWPFLDQIDHVDIRIDGPMPGGPPPVTNQLAYTSSCVPTDGSAGAQAETITLMHELGHGYGYDHMDGFLSSMNTGSWDFFSCELGTSPAPSLSMYVQPDPQPTSCHALVYGVPAGVDFSVSPQRQLTPGCTLGFNVRCNGIPGWGRFAVMSLVTGTSVSVTADVSVLNNRNAHAGTILVSVYMSGDNLFDATDVLVGSAAVSNLVAGEVRRVQIPVSFMASTYTMPVTNWSYRLIVRVDDLNLVSETRETNNVTDTRYYYRRTAS